MKLAIGRLTINTLIVKPSSCAGMPARTLRLDYPTRPHGLEERRMNITSHLRATAYHEADHAVVALFGGDRKPKRVTIVRQEDTLESGRRWTWR